MHIFPIDGSLTAFLSAVDRARALGLHPNEVHITDLPRPAMGLFDEIHSAPPVGERGREAQPLLRLCCASNLSERFDILHACLRAEQPGAPEVLRAEKLAAGVLKEVHRIQGLLRFRKTETGLWYAPINPDNDVTALLAPHFLWRMGAQPFMIHDVGRAIALLAGARASGFVCLKNLPAIGEFRLEAAPEEALVQELWKLFYSSITIGERENHRLRRRFMPRRYWEYLIELDNDA